MEIEELTKVINETLKDLGCKADLEYQDGGVGISCPGKPERIVYSAQNFLAELIEETDFKDFQAIRIRESGDDFLESQRIHEAPLNVHIKGQVDKYGKFSIRKNAIEEKYNVNFG